MKAAVRAVARGPGVSGIGGAAAGEGERDSGAIIGYQESGRWLTLRLGLLVNASHLVSVVLFIELFGERVLVNAETRILGLLSSKV